MAAMATPERAMTTGAVAIGQHHDRTVAPLWIVVTVVAAVLGALAGWQIRSLFQRPIPAALGQDLAYLATLVSVLIASGAQWLLFRRWRHDAFWWVPATVGASLLTAAIIVPTVLNVFTTPLGFPTLSQSIIVGTVALGASGLVIGLAQALALHASAGNGAWLWAPATGLGGALAGAITTALAVQLLGLPAYAFISLVAATSALLTAACQVPVLRRLLR